MSQTWTMALTVVVTVGLGGILAVGLGEILEDVLKRRQKD